MVAMIDTHCHLYAAEFDDDRASVIENTKQIGVKHILLPNIDIASVEILHQLYVSDKSFFKPMMGLHPCSVKENWETELEKIRRILFANEYQYIAVGEIGLDFYWDKTFIPQQEEAFRAQCSWACELNLPIAIHSRDATDRLIEILENMNPRPAGVFHCFSGNAGQVRRITAMGYYLGIGGVVTFKNSGLRETLQEIGVERVILETDAPYLAPVPYRGKRNSPEYLSIIAESVAQATNIDAMVIRQKTTENARMLFGL